MTFRVGAVLSEWGRRLQAHAIDHGEIEVVLVRDRRAALHSDLHTLCLETAAVWVDEGFVNAARQQGVVLIGVYASVEDELRWIEWGVEDRMARSVSADGMAFLLERLRPADPVDGGGAPDISGATARRAWGAPLVVGGPPGAGAREVAIAAASLLARSLATVLIDLNESGGGVARRVGYAESPNVLTAAGLVANDGDIAEAVAAPALVSTGARLGFDVISGLPSAAEWTRLSPSEAEAVLNGCARRWEAVVATTSPLVEDLRRWGDRFGVSRAILANASSVLGVCEASPRGVVRFGEWLADARLAGRVSVVINKAPARSPFVVGEVRERLNSLCGADRIEVLGSLPFDRRVVRGEWDATMPRSGPFTRGMRRMIGPLQLLIAETAAK